MKVIAEQENLASPVKASTISIDELEMEANQQVALDYTENLFKRADEKLDGEFQPKDEGVKEA